MVPPHYCASLRADKKLKSGIRALQMLYEIQFDLSQKLGLARTKLKIQSNDIF